MMHKGLSNFWDVASSTLYTVRYLLTTHDYEAPTWVQWATCCPVSYSIS